MRQFSYLIAALFIAVNPAAAQQRVDATIVVDGQQREFIVSIPSGAVPDGGYPLVFMFHGTSGDGLKFYNISGWKEQGERAKFVTVFPSSLEYCIDEDGDRKRTTKWVCGDLIASACGGQTFYDDTKFVRRMIDTIRSIVPINSGRIHASGFSNGGVFTAKLAVEMSDIFSSIAVSAGALNELDSAHPRAKIPIAYTIGSLDDRITGPAGIPELPANDSVLIYVGRIVRRFLGAFELTEDYEKSQTPVSLSYLWRTPLPGTTGSQFSFTLLPGLEHNYPNGQNHPVTAAVAFWNFFTSMAATSAAPTSRQLPLQLDLTSR